jgi:hypothetical protein
MVTPLILAQMTDTVCGRSGVIAAHIMQALTKEDVRRYGRQMILPEVGRPGLKKYRNEGCSLVLRLAHATRLVLTHHQ